MAKNSKNRYIDTRFWDDNYIISLKPLEKLVFLYCLTTPLTNIAGIYEIAINRMVFDLRIKADEIKRILQKFSEAKKIFYTEGWMIVVNFPKYQKAEENPKIKAGIEAIILNLPQYLLIALDTLSIPYVYPLNYRDRDRDRDRDSNLPLEEKPLKKELPLKEERKTTKQGNTVFNLMQWAEIRRGEKFVNQGKQLKAIAQLKKAGISPDRIKERWEKMENEDFWRDKGFDFLNVVNSFDKKL